MNPAGNSVGSSALGSSKTAPGGSLRFYEIDGLRFIAALIVVFYHYTFFGYAEDGRNPVSFLELTSVTRYGYLGVDLFFIISGFVILMTAQNGNPVRFVISRMVRIYPAFWVSVSISAVAMALFKHPALEISLPLWLKNLALVGSYVGVPFVDGVYWSLLVELKFYFLIFLVLVFRSLNFMEWLLGLWAVLIGILLFAGGPGLLHFFFFPDWAHYFIAGAMFYVIRTQGFTWYRVLLIAWCFVLSSYASLLMTAELTEKFGSEFHWPVTVLIIGGFYLFFTAIAFGITNGIGHPSLIAIGALTYPLYLLHQNIGYILLNLGSGLNRFALLCGVIAIAVFISWLVNVLVEDRFNPVFKQWLMSLARLLRVDRIYASS